MGTFSIIYFFKVTLVIDVGLRFINRDLSFAP